MRNEPKDRKSRKKKKRKKSGKSKSRKPAKEPTIDFAANQIAKYKILSFIFFIMSAVCLGTAVFSLLPGEEEPVVATTAQATTTSTTTTVTTTTTTSTTTSTTTLAPKCCPKLWFRGDIYSIDNTFNPPLFETDKKPIKYLVRVQTGQWVHSHFSDGSRPFLQTNQSFAECPTAEKKWFYCYCSNARACDCSNDFARFEMINKFPICA